jgi:hypothetical protein
MKEALRSLGMRAKEALTILGRTCWNPSDVAEGDPEEKEVEEKDRTCDWYISRMRDPKDY